MSKLTPSQVKNLIRRGIRVLVDPEPEPIERKRVIAFFDHCCAYCGCTVETGKGDLDHLLSSSLGGRNHISNRVFSCKPCNAEQKRDKDWEIFLAEKHRDPAAFAAAHDKIKAWVQSAGDIRPLKPEILEMLDEESRRVTAAYDDACRRLRAR